MNSIFLLKLKGICPSLVFGQPYIVVPSLREERSSLFTALWTNLKNNGQGLLMQIKDEINGYFVLIPMENHVFLLKSLATGDILTNCTNSADQTEVDDEVAVELGAALSRLKVASEFNPVAENSTDLVQSLTAVHAAKSRRKRTKSKPPSKKPTLNPKPQYDPLIKWLTGVSSSSSSSLPSSIVLIELGCGLWLTEPFPPER